MQWYISTLSLTSALDGDKWSVPSPGHFTPGKVTRYPSYSRQVSGPDRCYWVRTIQPVACFYTDCAVSRPPTSTWSDFLFQLLSYETCCVQQRVPGAKARVRRKTFTCCGLSGTQDLLRRNPLPYCFNSANL